MKYNIKKKSPNFEIESNIKTFLKTFTTENELKARIQWKCEHKEDDIHTWEWVKGKNNRNRNNGDRE